jgi:hypothetical protein
MYIYNCIYTCKYINTYTKHPVLTGMKEHDSVRIYIYINKYMYIHIYIHKHINIYTYMYMYIYRYAGTR